MTASPPEPDRRLPPNAIVSAGAAGQRPIAVIDIDGVVADVRHRLHHLHRRPADWFGFFDAAELDPPLPVGVERARQLDADHDIVWLTGRPEWLRSVTEQWLVAQGLPTGVLLMRGNADRRPARVLKASVLRALASGRPPRAGRGVAGSAGAVLGTPREIAVVIDDDSAVVQRLRADGWPVEQADWLGLEAPGAARLAVAQEDEGRT